MGFGRLRNDDAVKPASLVDSSTTDLEVFINDHSVVYNLMSLLQQTVVYEPAHDNTYNKTCVTSKRHKSACTSTKYGKDSPLSFLDSLEAMEDMRSAKTDQTAWMCKLI